MEHKLPPSKSTPRKLLVAGGGTGGHVWAGVAIAEAWKKKYGDEVLFVGAKGGLEEKLVPKSGYSLKLLSIGSLKRVSVSRRLKTFFQLPFAFVKSLSILMNFRPDVVIGVGGYSSGPLVLMARFIGVTWGARVAILE